jgi:hypothetical protein
MKKSSHKTNGSKCSSRGESRRRSHDSQGFSLSKSRCSIGTPQSSIGSHRRKRHCRGNLKEEFHKAKPPTFDSETKSGQKAEPWLLGMRKYFMFHDYFGNMKARFAFYNLTKKASIWWEQYN